MALSNVAPSLLGETLIVNFIGEVKKYPPFIKKTFNPGRPMQSFDVDFWIFWVYFYKYDGY
jgi:hypothetical protein